jgi:hypothetical protein
MYLMMGNEPGDTDAAVNKWNDHSFPDINTSSSWYKGGSALSLLFLGDSHNWYAGITARTRRLLEA